MRPSPCDVFVTRALPDPGVAPLRDAGLTVAAHDSSRSLTPAELTAGARGARAVLAMIDDPIDATLLDAAADLRVVANLGVGYDNVDVAHAAERGVVVTNTPDVLAEATADLTWALLLGAARRVIEGDAMVRSGRWTGWEPTQLLGLELAGRTLGIVGMGSIGTAVARRASGFGMRVLYHNRNRRPPEQVAGATYAPLPELLRQSDVVTLHAPLTPATDGLLGRAELQAMKPGAILINTARGRLVDEDALIEALRTGRIAAAGLDVYEREPVVPPALRELENTVLLPHLGSATTATRGRMVEIACANIVAVLAGDPPLTPVPRRAATS